MNGVGSSKAVFVTSREPAPSRSLPAPPPFCFIPHRVRKWRASLCRRVFTIRSFTVVSVSCLKDKDKGRSTGGQKDRRTTVTRNLMRCWLLVTFGYAVWSYTPKQVKNTILWVRILHGTFDLKFFAQKILFIKEYCIYCVVQQNSSKKL